MPLSTSGNSGGAQPTYIEPQDGPPAQNLSAEAQALRNQVASDSSAGIVRQDSGGMTMADYKYYLFNPSKMDSSLATASTAAWSVAGIAGGGAVGLAAGAAVIGAASSTISCPAATLRLPEA